MHQKTSKVNEFQVGAQLQGVRTFRSLSGKVPHWLMEWDFYPAPKKLCFYLDRAGVWTRGELSAGARTAFVRADHPVQLYIKAHFLNRRLSEWREQATEGGPEWTFRFAPDDSTLQLTIEQGQLRVRAKVPGRKDFEKSLLLARVENSESGVPAASPTPATGALPFVDKKYQKLIRNLEGDRAAAQGWLALFGALCTALEQDRSLWDEPEKMPIEFRAAVEVAMAKGELPTWGRGRVHLATEKLFAERRRMQRKVQKSMERQRQIEAKGPAVPAPKAASSPSAGPSLEESAARRPTQKPGLWVEIRPDLWARVGRTAPESDELFRQARDRDLWFHVRGQPGGHVWVPRGQPGFGAKDSVELPLIQAGAALALQHSKAGKAGGGADVDYTERRYLKKIRGVPGKVEILRSESHYVKVKNAK